MDIGAAMQIASDGWIDWQVLVVAGLHLQFQNQAICIGVPICANTETGDSLSGGLQDLPIFVL